MRVYVPATIAQLADPEGLAPRVAHAVTPALRAALPDEDDEGLEYAAQLLAADDSLDLLADDDVPRRVVVAADVPDGVVEPVPADGATAPSAVRLTAPVRRADVACAHVDEGEAADDVAAARGGDDDAVERLADRDLLWFDVSELDGLAASLLAR